MGKASDIEEYKRIIVQLQAALYKTSAAGFDTARERDQLRAQVEAADKAWTALVAENDKLRAEREESEFIANLCDRLDGLLSNTADALKGPPGELSLHSTHDLPEVAAALKAERDTLLAEIERLQRGVAFWLPKVPADDDEIAQRAGDDSFLLVGYDGPEEKSAEELGWVTLRAQVEALRKAIRTYGSHINDCPRNLSQPNCDWEMRCTCGFDAASEGTP